MPESATTGPAQERRGSGHPSEPAPTDAFQRAVTGYHDCVGEVVLRYSERLQKLNDQYVKAVQEASRAPTYEEQLKALDKASRRYNKASQESLDDANGSVQDCIKGYAESLREAFAEGEPDQVDPATLAYIGRETTFIADAAAGAFPPAWWLPIAED